MNDQIKNILKGITDFWNDLRNGVSKINEFKRIRKDKKEIWIKASYTPVKDKSGKVVRVIKFAQEITTTRQVIDSVKESIELAKKGVFNQEIKEVSDNQSIEELKKNINDLYKIISKKIENIFLTILYLYSL